MRRYVQNPERSDGLRDVNYAGRPFLATSSMA